MKTSILFLMYFLVYLTGFCQKVKVDSLQKLLNHSTSNTGEQVDLLIALSNAQNCVKVPAAISTADKAIVLARKLNDNLRLCRAYHAKGNGFIQYGKYKVALQILDTALQLSSSVKSQNVRADIYSSMYDAAGYDDIPNDYFERAEKIYKTQNNKRGLAMLYYLAASNKNKSYNFNEARLMFFEPLLQFKHLRNEEGVALCYSGLGSSNIFLQQHDSGSYYWGMAAGYFEKTGNVYGLAYHELDKGNSSYFQSDFAKAIDYYHKALKLFEQTGNYRWQASALDNMGLIYSELRKTKEAMDFYNRAIEIYTNNENNGMLAIVYMHKAMLLNYENKPEEAIKDLTQATAILKNNTDKIRLAECYSEIANSYITLKQYDIAIYYIKLATNFIEKTDSKYTCLYVYHQFGTVILKASRTQLINQGIHPDLRNKEAEKYFTKALKLARETNLVQGISDNLLALSEIYENKKDFSKALSFYKEYLVAKDSFLNAENSKTINTLNIQYQTERKEQQISMMNKDKEIQQKEIDRQKVIRNSFVAGFGVMLLFAGVFFFQRTKISKEKQRSDNLLLNILPEEVAEELKEKGSAEAKQIDEVTVLFTDFKNFTPYSEKLTPKELVKDIHECFSAFDRIMEKYGMEKIKTIGDSYMAAGGVPVPNKTHAVDAVKAAEEILSFIETGKAAKIAAGAPYLEIRIGIHTGPVVAGIVGVKKFAYDIWGDTVNTASRMESSGQAGKVNISEATYELVKDKFTCEYRGEIEAKNKGKLKMYFVS